MNREAKIAAGLIRPRPDAAELSRLGYHNASEAASFASPAVRAVTQFDTRFAGNA